MIAFPAIDPVALDLGPVKVHWYGLMYLIAFASAIVVFSLIFYAIDRSKRLTGSDPISEGQSAADCLRRV